MTKRYTQLRPEQRYQIECLIIAGKNGSEIADILGVNKSTISRELKRNTPQRGSGALVYDALKADKKTRNRHRTKRKRCCFTDDMKSQARNWLTQDKLSPELISARGKKELGEFVSHETIYKWIWDGKFSNHRDFRIDKNLHKELKHYGRRRKRANVKGSRSVILKRVSIENRPKIINQRKRLGDKEADIILGKNRKPGVLILTDRKLRMNWLEKIESKESKYIAKKIKKIVQRCAHKVKSITFDNDLAFAQHHAIRKELNIKTYFTHPFTSQEKGTVENRIGVIRQFFPKSTDFSKVTAAQIRAVERKLNQRPMRMFKYASPQEKYEKKVYLRC